MKFSWVTVCAAVALSALSAQATPVLGFAGIESGVPVAGQEDVVIYNFTGANGCSTAAGTPICTAVTFKNSSLLVNGTVAVALGDIAPGVIESYTFAGGTFPDGTITSLQFSATLSKVNLVDDLSNMYTFDAPVFIGNIAIDGSLTPIAGTLATTVAPEPQAAMMWTLGVLVLCAAGRKKRHTHRPLNR